MSDSDSDINDEPNTISTTVARPKIRQAKKNVTLDEEKGNRSNEVKQNVLSELRSRLNPEVNPDKIAIVATGR